MSDSRHVMTVTYDENYNTLDEEIDSCATTISGGLLKNVTAEYHFCHRDFARKVLAEIIMRWDWADPDQDPPFNEHEIPIEVTPTQCGGLSLGIGPDQDVLAAAACIINDAAHT